MASGGLDIWVSSTNFQKSNTGWPQQPPTEEVLNFNLISHEPTKNMFFQIIKTKLNSRTWMTDVLSSDFPGLRTSAASPTSTALFHQWTSWSWYVVGSSLAPKWPILVPFWGMDNQKSNSSLILAPFLSEAACSWPYCGGPSFNYVFCKLFFLVCIPLINSLQSAFVMRPSSVHTRQILTFVRIGRLVLCHMHTRINIGVVLAAKITTSGAHII